VREAFRLQWPASCNDCGSELKPGDLAVYYGRGRVYGRGCHEPPPSAIGGAEQPEPFPSLRAGMTVLFAAGELWGIEWDIDAYLQVRATERILGQEHDDKLDRTAAALRESGRRVVVVRVGHEAESQGAQLFAQLGEGEL